MEPLIGTILLWAVPWVPDGWMACEGQILPVQQYAPLFSLIGNYYGGDGIQNFALPDLRGRVPVGVDSREAYAAQIGIKSGNVPPHTHDLSDAQAEIPPHSGQFNMVVSKENGERSVAQNGDSLGAPKYTGRDTALYTNNTSTTAELGSQTVSIAGTIAAVNGQVGVTGQGQPMTINVLQPYATIRYIIAYEGVYPQRP